jgi:hypothetical protein
MVVVSFFAAPKLSIRNQQSSATLTISSIPVCKAEGGRCWEKNDEGNLVCICDDCGGKSSAKPLPPLRTAEDEPVTPAPATPTNPPATPAPTTPAT